MKKDKDGLERYDVEITWDGKGGSRTTTLHGAHAGEVANIRHQARIETKRGDTLTIKVK